MAKKRSHGEKNDLESDLEAEHEELLKRVANLTSRKQSVEKTLNYLQIGFAVIAVMIATYTIFEGFGGVSKSKQVGSDMSEIVAKIVASQSKLSGIVEQLHDQMYIADSFLMYKVDTLLRSPIYAVDTSRSDSGFTLEHLDSLVNMLVGRKTESIVSSVEMNQDAIKKLREVLNPIDGADVLYLQRVGDKLSGIETSVEILAARLKESGDRLNGEISQYYSIMDKQVERLSWILWAVVGAIFVTVIKPSFVGSSPKEETRT